MKRVCCVAFRSLLLVIFLLLYGCGDTNLFENMSDDGGKAARLEQSRMDLNAGNFDGVIAALKPLTNRSEQDNRYLASAYMGKAGFDTLKLLEEIAEDDDADFFDIITGIFDRDGDGNLSPDEELTNEEHTGKIDLIDEALEVLSVSDSGDSRLKNFSADDDRRLQRGVYAAVHAILSLSYAISTKYNLPPPVPLTIDALRIAFPNRDITLSDDDMLLLLPDLDRDLEWVKDGVNALNGELDGDIAQDPYNEENENDLHREFNTFLDDSGYSPDESVSGAELSGYLNNLLL